jgi:predicted CoA-substrate-specific enzyme activase
MLAHQAIAPRRLDDLGKHTTVGIDLGSRQAKAVFLNGQHLLTAITATGTDAQETADRLLGKLLAASGRARSEIDYVVSTGYGRVALEWDRFPSSIMIEISCHAMGAHFLLDGTQTIVDIGGQDSKAINVDPDNGRVLEFVMNDKCAAGTGRFLERIAELLDHSLDELGPRSLESTRALEILSQCVLFAESEVISLKACGERREDIDAAVHLASARRVRILVNRLGLEPELGVYKAIDDGGAAILGWQTPNVFTYEWREDVHPLRAIAELVPSGRMIGSPIHRLKSIEGVLKQTGSRGILFDGYVGFSFGGIHGEIHRDDFQKLGFPSISLEGSFQVGPPSGQLLTRVRTFVEMLS